MVGGAEEREVRFHAVKRQPGLRGDLGMAQAGLVLDVAEPPRDLQAAVRLAIRAKREEYDCELARFEQYAEKATRFVFRQFAGEVHE